MRGGAPYIAGTNVRVSALLEQWEAGRNFDQILKAFPHITYAQLRAAMRFCVVVMEQFPQE